MPIYLDQCSADMVMDTVGVETALRNVLGKALRLARDIRCKENSTNITKTVRQSVSGLAVANGTWSLIIGEFVFYGQARCRIVKECCCPGGKDYKSIQAMCIATLSVNDPYDFHSAPARWIPGVPYDIIINGWDSPLIKKGCFRSCVMQ